MKNKKKGRKAERERKRLEKELNKERKQKEREQVNAERAARKLNKKTPKSVKTHKRKRSPVIESSSDEDHTKIDFCDSDLELSDLERNLISNCYICNNNKFEVGDSVQCNLCDRKWHVRCTDNLVLQSMTVAELLNHEYFCDDCVFE